MEKGNKYKFNSNEAEVEIVDVITGNVSRWQASEDKRTTVIEEEIVLFYDGSRTGKMPKAVFEKNFTLVK